MESEVQSGQVFHLQSCSCGRSDWEVGSVFSDVMPLIKDYTIYPALKWAAPDPWPI